MATSLPRLTAAQAAARLAVKPQTLYAYVSRGLLARERGPRGSTFDALEVEAFASSRHRAAPRHAQDAAPGAPLMVLDADIALIEDGELFLRGIPAGELALGWSYESVARWLWDDVPGEPTAGEPGAGEPAAGGARRLTDRTFVGDVDGVRTARTVLAALGDDATALDRVQAAVPALGVADPTRHDLDPDAVRRAAERLIGGLVAALAPEASGPADGSVRAGTAAQGTAAQGTAARLWSVFTGRTPSALETRTLNAALVLLVDHDLAVSTLAARAAASARATPYAVVSCGLGALDSALHGNASAAASELIRLVLDGADARTALAQTVARTGRPAPGFGQPLYPGIDARAAVLLPLVARLPQGPTVVDAVDRLAVEVAARTDRHPNVDLALAALTTAAGMPADAGAAIFAIGRTAGWIAHALDEYRQHPLRLRPRGRYVGPPPAASTGASAG